MAPGALCSCRDGACGAGPGRRRAAGDSPCLPRGGDGSRTCGLGSGITRPRSQTGSAGLLPCPRAGKRDNSSRIANGLHGTAPAPAGRDAGQLVQDCKRALRGCSPIRGPGSGLRRVHAAAERLPPPRPPRRRTAARRFRPHSGSDPPSARRRRVAERYGIRLPWRSRRGPPSGRSSPRTPPPESGGRGRWASACRPRRR